MNENVPEAAAVTQMPAAPQPAVPAQPVAYAPAAGQAPGYPPQGYYPVPMPGKSKTTAVLLAVFLSFWTWCYTYKTNTAKFWTGLALCIISVPLDLVFVGWFISL